MNFMYLMQNMDFTEHVCRPKRRRKIKFNSVVNVVLIPCVKEMESMKNDLWWSKTDYASFYMSSCKELRDFMREHSLLDKTNAIKLLYQPSFEPATSVSLESIATNYLAQI